MSPSCDGPQHQCTCVESSGESGSASKTERISTKARSPTRCRAAQAARSPRSKRTPGHLLVSHLSDGVDLVDAIDPHARVELGRIALAPETIFSLGLTGGRLIVLGGGAWLYDATNPRALVPLGHADWSSDLGHGELLGDDLLVSGGNEPVSLPLTCDRAPRRYEARRFCYSLASRRGRCPSRRSNLASR